MSDTPTGLGEAQSGTIVLVVPPLIHAGVAFTSVAGPEHIGVAYLAAALRRAGFLTEIMNFEQVLARAGRSG